MTSFWLRKSVVAGLGLSSTLFLALAGCGGGGGKSDESLVRIEPGANVPTPAGGAGKAEGGAAGGAAPSTAEPASTSAAKPSAPVKAEGWGTLKGQVVFGGEAPAVVNLVEQGKAEKDGTVCAKDAPIKSERLEVDGATKGVKNVIVYIPRPTAVNDDAKKAAASATVEFDQEKCIFEPHVLAVLSSGKITLKSSDPVNHNVNAKLKANSPFNSILSAGQSIPFVPSTGERSPAEVTCDIHPWMKAFWLISESPYFAVTDAKGNFEIKNVPAGTQKVVVWQEAVKGGFVTAASGQEINIKPNGEVSEKFTIDPGKILPGK